MENLTGMIVTFVVVILVILLIALSFRVVRPTHRGLIERLGKYNRFANPGLNVIIPFVDTLRRIDITERMIDAGSQEIITADKLNASVDAQVYFRVRQTEEGVKASQYNVQEFERQIVSLARTTLRNIIGTLTLTSANSERNIINGNLYATLEKETGNWGIDIVRTELKEINPPADVQTTMNSVVMAENKKQAAVDFATAAETEADGKRRAAIKAAEGARQAAILEAEGNKQSRILIAEGEAAAIKLVNEAAEAYFKGNAQKLRQLQAVEAALTNNSKIVLPSGTAITNVIGNLAGLDGSTGS
ncbi:putative stomatin/prohibitin-family membrane protease subunit YbbK [Dehalogenimonas sp. WBC-2]|nr:putative stomatin/prohibitin-family membrane protease subunit YbbK [Dehalogenimonas sp. WBC-2]